MTDTPTDTTNPAVGAGSDRRWAELLDRLHTGVADLVDGPAWQQMLTVAARFHTYSPTNQLLIGLQRPDATRVAGYHTWRSLGRQVRRGEHAITILAPILRRGRTDPRVDARTDSGANPPDPSAPSSGTEPPSAADPETERRRVLRGFRPVHVFDLAQTDGEPLPEIAPTLLAGQAPPGLWTQMVGQVSAAGYSLDRAEVAPANGRTDFTGRTVSVAPTLSPAQAVKTLTHELAHVLLHHPDVAPAGTGRRAIEVEAESVAFIVTGAHRMPADDYTVPYIAGWAGGDLDAIRATASRVLGCARQILTLAPPAPDPVFAAARARAADRLTPAPATPDRTRTAGREHRPGLGR